MNFIIGCGGIGSWLTPKLAKMTDQITLIDGDKLEEKNLDRQLFDERWLGANKAMALGESYGFGETVGEFFHAGLALGIESDDILFCCADNHACRRAVLQVCDEKDCRCVIAANEETEYESYWYERSWKDTPNDPRIFYPVILTDHSDDPLGPPGCTGEAQIARPQLAIANDAASSAALFLWWFHTKERPKLPDEDKPYWPVLHRGNPFQFRTVKYGARLIQE